MKKKILMIILSLIMAVTMMPLSIFAETTNPGDSETAAENVTGATTTEESESLAVDPSTDYLSFTARDGSAFIKLAVYAGEPEEMNLVYSADKINWFTFTLGEDGGFKVEEDQTIYVKLEDGKDPVYPGHVNVRDLEMMYWHFVADNCSPYTTIEAGGNIMSLVSHDLPNALTIEEDGGFVGLFSLMTNLTKAPNLPATNLSKYSYASTFAGCPIKTAPELPAMEAPDGCYSGMFSWCDLTEAPELPALIVGKTCYSAMFQNCPALRKASKLPATRLNYACYSSMFEGCTALTKAPELPATDLDGNCYRYMFSGCTSLTKAPELPATELEEACYYSMFSNCTHLEEVPELPAKELEKNCYYRMFSGCSNLKKINVCFTQWDDESSATYEWLNRVASSGVFNCPEELPTDVRDGSHVPVDWVVGKTYPINLTQPGAGEGALRCNVTRAASGDTPILSYDSEESGYMVDYYTAHYYNAGGEKVDIDVDIDGTFLMPDFEVFASVKVKPAPVMYAITKGQSDHVEDFILQSEAEGGSKVVLPEINIEEGYTFKQWNVTGEDGAQIDVREEQPGAFYFEMPAQGVTVVAEVDGYNASSIRVEGATVTSPGKVEAGKLATYELKLEEGYGIDGDIVVYNKNLDEPTEIPVTIDGNTFSHAMPMFDTVVRFSVEKINYRINIINPEHGITIAKVGGDETDRAHVNDKVTLETNMTEGYMVSEYIVMKMSTGKLVEVDEKGEFLMPADNIVIDVEEKENIEYAIAIGEQNDHVKSLTTDKSSAVAGETVAITGEAEDSSNPIKAYHVYKTNGSEIELKTENTFVMPESNVAVYAEVAGYNATSASATGAVITNPQNKVPKGQSAVYELKLDKGCVLDGDIVIYNAKTGKPTEIEVTSFLDLGVFAFTMPMYDVYAVVPTKTMFYTVNCNWNYSGKDEPYNYQEVTPGQKAIKPADPERTGFEFGGWYDNSLCIGEQFDFNKAINANCELYAKWNPKEQYSIAIGEQNDHVKSLATDKSSADIGETVTITGVADDSQENPIKAYHVFKTDGTEVKVEDDGTFVMPASNVTVYAEVDHYYATSSETQGAIITPPAQGVSLNAKAMYGLKIAKGYALDEDKKIEVHDTNVEYKTNIPVAVSEDQTSFSFTMPMYDVYVVVPIKTMFYTVNCNWNYPGKDEPYNSQEVAPGQKATKPADPERTGFVFGGWYENSLCIGEQFDFNKAIDANCELYAKWTAKENYAIATAKRDHVESIKVDSSAYEGDEVKVEAIAIDSDNPIKQIHIVPTDESIDEITIKNNDSFIMPASNVTVFAEVENYLSAAKKVEHGRVDVPESKHAYDSNVYFTAQADTGYQIDSINILETKTGKIIQVDVVPFEGGYIFKSPMCDTTVEVIFSRIIHNITTVNPKHCIIDVQKTAYEGETVSISSKVDEGYELYEYEVTNDATGDPVTVSAAGTFKMPESSVTVTANVDVKRYSVVIAPSLHGTAKAEKDRLAPGEVATIISTPDEGYLLEGYDAFTEDTKEPIRIPTGTGKFTMPAENVVVIPNFTKNIYVPDIQGFSAYAPGCASVVVKWEEIDKSNIRYFLYKSTDPSRGWDKVYQAFDYDTTEFTDTNVVAGTKYYYKMRAGMKVEGEWIYGNFTNVDYGYPRINDIQNFRAKADTAASAEISWNQVADKDIKYFLYKGTKPYGDWGPRLAILDNDHNYYHDTDVEAGTKYYYMVRPAYKQADGSYLFGNYTKVDYAWPRVIPVNDLKSWAVDSKTAKLTWTRSSQSNLRYYIYRGTKPYGDWGKPIATLSGSETSFIDKNLKSGQKYYYLIKVGQEVDGKMYYSEYSNMDYAWPR